MKTTTKKGGEEEEEKEEEEEIGKSIPKCSRNNPNYRGGQFSRFRYLSGNRQTNHRQVSNKFSHFL